MNLLVFKHMIFSVVVPTYNRLGNLKEVLEALRNQTVTKDEFEIIIIDDGSSDGTKEYLSSLKWEIPRITVLYQQHRGPAAARNLGIDKSIGEIIAFTDDDCLVPLYWLASLKEGYETFSSVAGIGGYLEASTEVLKNNPIARLEYFETHSVYHSGQEPYLGGFESPSGGTNNMSYQKSVLLEVGLFDEGFPVPAGEDADLKLRVTEKGYKIGYIPLKVIHLDPYSFKTFIRRSVTHGVGSAFFEAKHGKSPSTETIAFNIISLPLIFVRILKKTRDFELSFLMMVKNLLMDVGRVKYFRSVKK